MSVFKWISLLVLCFNYYDAFADVRLPKLISDSMVLQRDAKINIWGWADKGEKISISFAGKKYNTTTGENGKWATKLSALKSGGPYTMVIEGLNKIVLKEIMIGDVWFCAGQSNMVHQMELHKETYASDIANANNYFIRQFHIATLTNLQTPVEDFPTGQWKAANPHNVGQFSAVAYFFAKKLYDKYKVPIGIINASVGGTPIEAWTSEEGFKDFSTVLNIIQKNKDTAYVNGVNRAAAIANPKMPKPNDKGLTAAIKWFDTSYKPKGWLNINVPGYWEDQGIINLDGIVWYRREINIPASMINQAAKVALGRIVDADALYVNGVQVGNTGYQYPQRRYAIPTTLLNPGKNILVVRVTNNSGKGGFVPDKPYYLSTANDTIDLKGTWQYKVGEAFAPFKFAENISAQNQPTALYNAMVAPATQYSIKGFAWYQGESNISNANQYDKLLPALIKDWRTKWQQGELPFLYVQLPNFQDVTYLPAESGWAVLREAQRKTLTVPNTGMAVAIDLGEWNDIHPDNKKDVGERLALVAEKIAYGESNIVHSGPMLSTYKKEHNKIILSFDNIGSGLVTNDGEELFHFAIAGADKKYVWAKATIKGNTITVWNDSIAEPKYIRYAWADNPAGANLYNKEGLPASPFQVEIK